MKNLTFFLFLSLLLCFEISTHAQTAIGGCNSVSLISVPSYPLVHIANWRVCPVCESQCNKRAVSIPTFMQTRNWLEKKQSNGSWVVVQGGTGGIHGDNVVFTVSDPGVYRIRNQKPRKKTTSSCPNGFEIFLDNGQQTDFYQGIFTEFIPGNSDFSWSNEVFVGPVQPNQIAYEFVDGGGGNLSQTGFDFNELVRINTTGSQNFTQWWVAIFENDGPMRWNSIGWQSGPLPTLVNLTNVWGTGNGNTWKFETFRSYTVQFALSNPCNQQWTNLDKTFFICPSGTGCREIESSDPISISPNPTYGQFELKNLSDTPATITVMDMSGRELKRFNNSQNSNYDISDLNNGIYIVSVIQDNKRVLNSKISVLK